MADPDPIPSKTDTGWFTDGDQLTAFLEDSRISDQRRSSSFDDAQMIVLSFAAETTDGAWTSLDRATVAERLATLLQETTGGDSMTGYRSLAQAGLNLCGPAALLMLAAGRDPAAVATYATQLFDTGAGAIGGLAISASDSLLATDFSEVSSHGSISSQAEWMMLSAVRNATEAFWQPEWTGDPEQELAGMTRPEELADWMRQTAIWARVDDNGRWASNPGIPNATSLSVAEGTDTAVLIHANLLKESQIIGQIDGPAARDWSPLDYFPNHWVVLLSEIIPSVDQTMLEFTVWTWASRVRLRAPQQVFIDNYFGTVSAVL